MPQTNPRRKKAPSAAQSVSSVRIGDIGRAQRRTRGLTSTRSRKPVIIVIAIAVVLVAGAIAGGVLYASGAFAVTQVTVSGVSHLTAGEMTQLAGVPSNTTLLRMDSESIRRRLMGNAWVADARIERVFPDTVNLAITERTIAAVVTITSTYDQRTENWAVASDDMWLMKIPDRDSDEGRQISSQVYEDAQQALHITDVPYGVSPEVGSYCTDESVKNAIAIVAGMTTSLADRVTTVSATGTDNTTLTLDNGVQIAFGSDSDIRSKERVCMELMEQYPDQIAYINVRVVDRPTWRSVDAG